MTINQSHAFESIILDAIAIRANQLAFDSLDSFDAIDEYIASIDECDEFASIIEFDVRDLIHNANIDEFIDESSLRDDEIDGFMDFILNHSYDIALAIESYRLQSIA